MLRKTAGTYNTYASEKIAFGTLRNVRNVRNTSYIVLLCYSCMNSRLWRAPPPILMLVGAVVEINLRLAATTAPDGTQSCQVPRRDCRTGLSP